MADEHQREQVLIEAARKQWPSIELSPQRFAALSARHGAWSAQSVADLYLAAACLDQQPSALFEFDRLLRQAARSLRPGLTDAVGRDELCQQVRVRLLVAPDGTSPKLAEYSGRGPLMAWLRVLLVRQALNQHRSQHRALAREEASAVLAAEPVDPEVSYLRNRHRDDFNAAFKFALTELPSEQRTLLRLHFLHRLGIDQLAKVLGVGRSTAARRLAASRSQLLNGTRAWLSATLKVTASQLDSLVRQLKSELDVSLRRCLEEAPHQ